MNHFYEKVDTRSRQAMIDFLTGHFRYNTMNSWNGMGSYANNVNIHRLGLTNKQTDAAYEILGRDYWDEIQYPIDEFTEEMHGRWTIGSNGRSSGYLVLYESEYEYTEHQSRCTACGQLNFKAVVTPDALRKSLKLVRIDTIWPLVEEIFKAIEPLCNTRSNFMVADEAIINRLNESIPESSILDYAFVQPINREMVNSIGVALHKLCRDGATIGNDNKCGRCGAHARENLKNRIRHLKTSAKSVDSEQDFSELDIGSLRDRVRLVQRFDKACDHIRSAFIALCDDEADIEVTDKAA